MRGDHLTVVDERHHRFYHLDGGGNPVTLADADRNGIALIPEFFLDARFPCAAGKEPVIFLMMVDARRFDIVDL